MKRPAEAPEIIQFFDKSELSGDTGSSNKTDLSEPETGDTDPKDPVEETEQASGLVNINTASQSELETLPGIGPVKAKAIIEYRRSYKGFVAPEEIMEVRGIGPATYEKIRDRITLE